MPTCLCADAWQLCDCDMHAPPHLFTTTCEGITYVTKDHFLLKSSLNYIKLQKMVYQVKKKQIRKKIKKNCTLGWVDFGIRRKVRRRDDVPVLNVEKSNNKKRKNNIWRHE
jgi:hypothetical protein